MNGETYIENAASITNNRGRYKSMLWALDNEIGRLLDNVDLTTTTVILLGDNGTPANVIADENLFPSNHGKGSLYEGGVRVPMLIRPAGGVTGTVSTELVNGVDIFPTMCDLMGIDASSLGEDLDGQSLVPILNSTDTADRYAVAEAFQNNQGEDARAIRKDDYKLIIIDDPQITTDTPSLEFYDLSIGLQENAADDLLRAGYTMTATEQAAYDDLIAYNDVLNVGHAIQYDSDTGNPPATGVVTTSINLANVTTTGGNIPPLTGGGGNTIVINSLTVGGVSATNYSRTTNGTTQSRNWITFDFDQSNSGLSAGNYDIVVTYSTPTPRVITYANGYSHQ